MSSKLKPFPKKIVIQREVLSQKTAGGIILPEQKLEMSGTTLIGKVIAIGEDIKNVNIGDIVVTHKGRVLQLDVFNETYFTMGEEDLWCTVDKEAFIKENAEQKTEKTVIN